VLQGRYEGVTSLSEICYKGVVRVLQQCYTGVVRHRCVHINDDGATYLPLSCEGTYKLIHTATTLASQGCYKSVTTAKQEFHKGVTRVLYPYVHTLPRECCVDHRIKAPLQGHQVKMLRLLQECYKGVTRVFQECYESVTKPHCRGIR
jgi:hypothetical protein